MHNESVEPVRLLRQTIGGSIELMPEYEARFSSPYLKKKAKDTTLKFRDCNTEFLNRLAGGKLDDA